MALPGGKERKREGAAAHWCEPPKDIAMMQVLFDAELSMQENEKCARNDLKPRDSACGWNEGALGKPPTPRRMAPGICCRPRTWQQLGVANVAWGACIIQRRLASQRMKAYIRA